MLNKLSNDLFAQCEICNGNMVASYAVEGSRRGNQLGVCERCGTIRLIPSHNYDPSSDSHSLKYNKSRHISPSEGALWGNIRHGKGLRLTHSKAIISKYLDNNSGIIEIFDDGSNRGAFMDWIKTRFPQRNVSGCEPDIMIWDQCSEFVRSNSERSYLEDLSDMHKKFDLVYSAHTLEHVDNVIKHINKIKELLKSGGTLIIDLPNSDQMLAETLCLEEYFVEKHRNNFFSSQFAELLKAWGFSIIESHIDNYNFVYICSLDSVEPVSVFSLNEPLTSAVAHTRDAVKAYLSAQNAAVELLRGCVEKVNSFGRQRKYVIWGGGRLLGTLMDHGLELENIEYVIDDHLYDKIPNFRGIKLCSSAKLRKDSSKPVFVNARSSTDQILQILDELGVTYRLTLRDLVCP